MAENNHVFSAFLIERTKLVFHPVFKTGSRRIKPAVAGSIPAFSANNYMKICYSKI